MTKLSVFALVLVLSLPEAAQGQRWYGGSDYTEFNVPYDGRFTFVRLSFTPLSGMRGWGGRGRRGGGGGLYWDHDYPIAENHLNKLLMELTDVTPYMEGTNILGADDPELGKYPIAYVSEPGHWDLTDEEAQGLRNYLLKGGFLIFDDFAGGSDWIVFEQGMQQVLPGVRPMRLDFTHDIFHSFFDIDSLELAHPNYYGYYAEFWGVFEDNDPDGRLLAIVNYNADIGDYWEWSDRGWVPIPLSNEAYKLGINYIVYAMTH